MDSIERWTSGATSRFSRCARSISGPWTAMIADSPSITPIRPVGQERMKSGSNPCPAIA